MAIRLLVALIALGLLRALPQLAHCRRDGLFRRWVAQLADTSGAGRVVLALLPPLLLCLLLRWLFDHPPLGDLLSLLFALAVLLYCFGPREFESDVEAILNAPDQLRREVAAQQLIDDDSTLVWTAPGLGEAVAYAALRRRFAVLFWFFVLGSVGALLYRLAQTLARNESLRLDASSDTAAQYLANALDWVPAQLLVFTLAVVGHWDAVIGAWSRWHSQAATTSWYTAPPGFLGAAAQADILTDIEAGDGYFEERSEPMTELLRLRGALLRALLAWLSVVALIVIGGWLN